MTQQTVLLVDDDPDICNVLALVLERKFNIIKAYTGQDAVDLLNKHYETIDVLITDIRLLDYSGVDLYALAIQKCGPELQTIFVTGNDAFDNSEVVRNEPNVEIKLKPFSPTELCADVERMLSE